MKPPRFSLTESGAGVPPAPLKMGVRGNIFTASMQAKGNHRALRMINRSRPSIGLDGDAGRAVGGTARIEEAQEDP
jgi:hypothetical protein